MRKNKPWYAKPDMIIALSALLVSFVATFVGVYSAWMERSYARASLWPRVEISRSANFNRFVYTVENSGTGPAIIQQASVSLNGKYYQTWGQWLADAYKEKTGYSQSHMGSGVMESGEQMSALMIKESYGGNRKIIDKLLKKDALDITICYCSVFEECWMVDRRNLPKEVNACTIPKAQLFKQ